MARRNTRSTRKRSRKSRSGSRESSWFWYVVIAACFAIVGSVVYVSQSLISSSKIDEATLCHTGGALNVTSILLDLTDPLSETQQSRLKLFLDAEIANSSVDTMIALGVVSENSANWGAKFSKCKPATGELANGLYENPVIIAARYDREFTQPIERTLASMLTGISEDHSPIMEAMQSLLAETPDFSSAQGFRKIIIVSDMLQNSETLSFYRGQGWEYFAQNNGIERLAGSLSGASVEIWRIPRSGAGTPSNDITEGFWTRYFDKQGSRPPSVKSLGDL